MCTTANRETRTTHTMAEEPTAGVLPRETLAVLGATPWPLAIVDGDDRLVTATQALAEALGSPPEALPGTMVASLLADGERALPASALEQVRTLGRPVRIRLHLRRAGQAPLDIDAEIEPAEEIGPGWVSIVCFPNSFANRRERLLLEMNRLAPVLLGSSQVGEVFQRTCVALRPLGLEIIAGMGNQDRTGVSLEYHTDGELFSTLSAPPLAALRPPTVSLKAGAIATALRERRAFYAEGLIETLREAMPGEALGLASLVLRLRGVHGYICAPLIDHDDWRGVLFVRGPGLRDEDVPFAEALANQISAVLAQIELRAQMQTQIQRLDSLAATAQAVTSLVELDGVLRVICLQAQELLSAESAAVGLPVDDGMLRCQMATGLSESLIGATLPIEGTLAGKVFRTGEKAWIDDMASDNEISPAVRAAVPSLRAALVHPIADQGGILGVLSVAHTLPGRFTKADLEMLGRYAVFAAAALSNARLLGALRRSEQQARAAMEQAQTVSSYLNTLIHTAPNVLVTIDLDMQLHLLNPARAATLTGYPPASMEGRSLLDFVPPHLHDRARAVWSAIVAGIPRRVETELLRADGGVLRVQIDAALVPDYQQVFAILNDVTEQRALEGQVRQSEQLAAQARLVAGAAHELNNPLAIILGLTQLQQLEELPQATLADLDSIERAAHRASGIVQQLQTFGGPPAPLQESVDLGLLVREGLGRLGGPLGKHNIEVVVEIPSDLPTAVGDPRQLAQAVSCVIDNAVKALATSLCHQRRLTIRGRCERDDIRLAFIDNGPGVAPEDLTRIFEPFYTTRMIGEGVGLGLAVVHTIVQQHGGRVWAESTPGGLTTICLALPLGGR